MSNASANWKTISQKLILHTPFMDIWEDEVEQPDGKLTKYYIRRKPPFSIIIPLHHDKKVTLVRQYRYAVRALSLEFPMGFVAGSNPQESAITELQEEAGLMANIYTLLAHYWSAPGHTDQETYVYLAEDLTSVTPKPESGEFFDIENFTLDEVSQFIKNGEIKDVNTIASFFLLEKFLAQA